ncbi:MAG: response regulator transcription factor [Pseudomonadota bacterium]
MQDIFISPLKTGLVSWLEAFPKAKLSATVEAKPTKIQKSNPVTFWLHMNEDRQEWLTNTIRLIQKKYENAKIVVLANTPNHTESLHVLSLGARGYCHAFAAPAVVTNGGIWLGQDLLQRLIEVSTRLIGNRPDYVQGLLAKLTKREKEVAVEAAKGLSNKEIARILAITERTVKAHLASTFERLGAKDRLQLALMLNDNYKHVSPALALDDKAFN